MNSEATIFFGAIILKCLLSVKPLLFYKIGCECVSYMQPEYDTFPICHYRLHCVYANEREGK